MRRSRRRSRSASQEGAAATEFVLIAPILIVIFFGIVYVGIAVFRTQVIEAAAREGARVASVGAPAADVEAAAISAASGFSSGELVVDTSDDCTGPGDNTTVIVTATGARLNFTIPFLGSWEPEYSASAVFRCERATS